MQRSGMHMRGHAESHGERDPAQGGRSGVPCAQQHGGQFRQQPRGGARRQEQGAGRGLGGGGVLARQRGAVGIASAAMTIVGAQDRDGIAGSDDEGSDHQKYGLSLRASMQSKTTTKAKVGEASVQIAQDSNSQVRHGPRQRRLGGAAAAAGDDSGAEAPSQGRRPLASIVPVLGLSEDCKAPLRPLGWPAACANRRRGRGFPVHTYRRFRACESAQFFVTLCVAAAPTVPARC